jgi:ABC-type multidrug transport system, ATPase component
MKQRLGIASALLGQPKLLILDEPTNGLDPSGILEIRELIKSMPSKYGITVLISSHLLSEVEQMAGTVGIIRNGALVFQDSMPDLRRQAQSSISLRVSEPERALAKLKGGGLDATLAPANGFIELASCRDDEVARIVRGLMERGHDIYRVEERRKSLEDLFLQIVEGGKPS